MKLRPRRIKQVVLDLSANHWQNQDSKWFQLPLWASLLTGLPHPDPRGQVNRGVLIGDPDHTGYPGLAPHMHADHSLPDLGLGLWLPAGLRTDRRGQHLPD